MKLKANFVADWQEILKDILVNHWGYDISGVTPDDIAFVYFNAEKRRPDMRPRSVELSDTFNCPAEHKTGLERLKNLIESGGDITPNLSKLVAKLTNKDSMLNDWGVHHFHLGENLDGQFIKRTGPLLFALVSKDKFYAIGIYQHGAWADTEVVETIHRNWPEAVEKFKLNGVSPTTEIKDKNRLTLRAKNVNSFVTVSDGTVYAPLGGGVLASGYNVQARLMIDRQTSFLEALEANLKNHLPDIIPVLQQYGYNSEPEISATLEINDKEYVAIFPKYGVYVKLMQNA